MILYSDKMGLMVRLGGADQMKIGVGDNISISNTAEIFWKQVTERQP